MSKHKELMAAQILEVYGDLINASPIVLYRWNNAVRHVKDTHGMDVLGESGEVNQEATDEVFVTITRGCFVMRCCPETISMQQIRAVKINI